MRGSCALKRLEEERLGQLANQAKQYITLMEEYRSVHHTHGGVQVSTSHSWRSTGQYITLMEEYRSVHHTHGGVRQYITLMEEDRSVHKHHTYELTAHLTSPTHCFQYRPSALLTRHSRRPSALIAGPPNCNLLLFCNLLSLQKIT